MPSPLSLIGFLLHLQENRTGIKNLDKFEFLPDWTVHWSYLRLSAEKLYQGLIMEKVLGPRYCVLSNLQLT